jgi:hypothetical protein
MQAALNYLIPLALAATLLVLGLGIFAMLRGGRFNRAYGNLFMRWRLILQFVAIGLIAATTFLFGR